MFKKLLLALGLWGALVTGAAAQNVQCANRTAGDSTNACANTRFVTGAVAAVPYTAITSVPAHRFLGNNTGATANAIAMTATEATAELNAFTDVLKGLAPASGGGTTNFLRADGTWNAPATGIIVDSTTVTGGTSRGELYNNSGVVGNLPSLVYDVRKYAVAPKTASTVCNGSGDDTATIQAAIDAANTNVGGTVVFPAGSCILASTLSFNDKRNIVLQGQGAGRNLSSALTSISYSAATGNAATFDGAIGIISRGINWLYTHATYNGDLFDLRQESGAANTNLITFEDCFIWGNSGTAASFFRLGAGPSGGSRATLSFRLQRCLIQGAIQAINGGTNSNNVYIANNFFNTNTGTTSHIGVRGEGWTLLNNTFEPTATTVTNNVIANGATNGLAIVGNTFNDGVTGTLITLTGGAVTGLHIAGNILQGGEFSINAGSAVGVSINGNYLNSNSTSNLIINSATIVTAQGNWGPGTLVGTLPAASPYLVDRNNGSNLLAASGFSLGIAGSRVGAIEFNNATSGTITVQPVTGALGTQTISLPAASGTVAVSATTPATLSSAGDIGVLPSFGLVNHSLAVSANAGALTISLKDAAGSDPSATSPVIGNFRNVTGATGSWTQRKVTAANSLTISSGSTLGVTSSTAFRIWVVLFDDGGTMRLGAINCNTGSGILPLPEQIASSTAEGGAGAADSAGVIYTGTAVSSKAYLIVGNVEWNTTGLTAGTWTTTNVNYVQAFGAGMKRPGDVVQAVRGTTTSVTSTSSTSYVTTGVTATVPKTSAANVVQWSFGGLSSSPVPTTTTPLVQMHRAADSTPACTTAIGPVGFQTNQNNVAATRAWWLVAFTDLDFGTNITGNIAYTACLKGSGAFQVDFPEVANGVRGVMTILEIMG